MKIGSIEIKGYAALAPMAGVADRAMRELCRYYGAAFTVGELTSSRGIVLNDKKSAALLTASDKERPFGSQLFGNSPEIMAEAARAALRFNPDFIDINMGCPAPKVASNGGGSALMKEPLSAGKMCIRDRPRPERFVRYYLRQLHPYRFLQAPLQRLRRICPAPKQHKFFSAYRILL